jgi:sugar phosphate isomerase/epimerase
VRFGLCCGLAEADDALAAGFDYIELPASQLLENRAEYARLAPEATNLFFPGAMRLYGPEKGEYMAYAREVVPAAAEVGVRTMVIGSGAARKCPEGMQLDRAEAAFVRIASEITDIAEPLGLIIAPESLNRTETNVCNDLGSMAANLRTLGVAYTADSYHVISEWVFDGHEGPPTMGFWRDQVPYLPAHVHLGSRDRVDPLPDDPDLEGFVKRLFELGYDGRVSLECRRRANQSLAQSLADVRALFA